MRSWFSPSLGWILFLAACVLCADPITAWAEPDDAQSEVERLSAEGVSAYRAGDHARALVLFGEAYQLDPVPNLLFNMARAHEKMGNDREAERHYGRFLAAPGVSEAAAKRARSLLVATQERLDAARALAVPVQGGNESGGSREATAFSLGSSASMNAYRVPAWTAIGTGLALVSVGVACTIFALDSKDAFHASDDAGVKSSHRESAESFALAADVTYGLGGISAAVGTALLFIDGPSEVAANRSVAPALWPDGGGVAATVQF